MTNQESTLKLIQAYYQGFNDKNWDAIFAMLDPGIVHEVCEGPTERGLQAFKEFVYGMNKHYSERHEDFAIMATQDGAHASAEFMCYGKYHTTCPGLPTAKNQDYKLRVGAFFEIKNGKIARVSTHYNLKAWIASVS
jgi:steroid delta-isomerase-like uncharacterized protein